MRNSLVLYGIREKNFSKLIGKINKSLNKLKRKFIILNVINKNILLVENSCNEFVDVFIIKKKITQRIKKQVENNSKYKDFSY